MTNNQKTVTIKILGLPSEHIVGTFLAICKTQYGLKYGATITVHSRTTVDILEPEQSAKQLELGLQQAINDKGNPYLKDFRKGILRLLAIGLSL